MSHLAHRPTERSRIVAVSEKYPIIVDALDLAENVLRREEVVTRNGHRRDAHGSSLQDECVVSKQNVFLRVSELRRCWEFNLRCYNTR